MLVGRSPDPRATPGSAMKPSLGGRLWDEGGRPANMIVESCFSRRTVQVGLFSAVVSRVSGVIGGRSLCCQVKRSLYFLKLTKLQRQAAQR
jgi:hypothetical protein